MDTTHLNDNVNIEKSSAKSRISDKERKLLNVEIFTKSMLEEMLRMKHLQESGKLSNCSESGRTKPEDVISPVSWENSDASGEVSPVDRNVSFSAINYMGSKAKAFGMNMLLGFRIDLKEKLSHFREEYKRHYILSKSHNFLAAKWASMKVGFFGMMLSMLNIGPEEISALQKEAKEEAISQNTRLFEENEYTGELLEIMGGSKKKIKAERQIISEIRKQLMSQMKNLGNKDYYSPEKVLDVQKEQCETIYSKLVEEKNQIEYQRTMMDMGIGLIESFDDLQNKITKITRFVVRASARLDSHKKAFSKMFNKAEKNMSARDSRMF